jgi:hypothetical protein
MFNDFRKKEKRECIEESAGFAKGSPDIFFWEWF